MSGSFTDPDSARTEAVLNAFNDVFQKHDPQPLHNLVAENCVMENTQPAPDGGRFEGGAQCVALWSGIASDSNIQFETESVIARGDRGVITWRMRWGSDPSSSVRGVNLMRVRGGKIVEAQGYVKALPRT